MVAAMRNPAENIAQRFLRCVAYKSSHGLMLNLACHRGSKMNSPCRIMKSFLGIIFVSFVFPSTKCVRLEGKLRRDLFREYENYTRPVDEWSDPLKVYLDYSPLYFIGLNGAEQTFSIYGWLGTKWYNKNLTWNPSKYGGIEYLLVNPRILWYPDLGIINSVSELYGEIFRFKEYQGKLYSDGWLRVVTAGSVQTTCIMDVTYFPFDEQVCHIEIDSWTAPNPQIILSYSGAQLKMEKLRPNEQWTIIDSWIHTEKSTVWGSEFQTLSFVFRMRRKATYIMVNFLFPCIGMVVMELIVFWLPPDSGEKVSLGITLLLAQTVYQLIMQGDMPRTSDNVPLINLYVLMSMALSGMILLTSASILTIHHRRQAHPIPSWMRRLLLNNVTTGLGIHAASKKKLYKSQSYMKRDCSNGGTNSNEIFSRDERVHGDSDSEEDDASLYAWTDIARALDRLCFTIYLALVFCATVGFLLLSYCAQRTVEAPLGGYGYQYKNETS